MLMLFRLLRLKFTLYVVFAKKKRKEKTLAFVHATSLTDGNEASDFYCALRMHKSEYWKYTKKKTELKP